MGVFEKYQSSLVDFKDYRSGSIRNIAYPTNSQNNTAKLIKGGLFCSPGLTQNTIIPDDTQFAFARNPFVMFACFKSFDDLGIHHIYSAHNTGNTPRIIIRRYPTNTNNINIVDSANNSVFTTSITIEKNERTCFLVVIVPSANLAYVYKNGIFNHSTSIATLVGNFSFLSTNTIGAGVGRTTDMNDILYYAGMYKNLNLTASEVAELHSELESMPEQKAWSKAIADGSSAGEIYFKGELGIRANEYTIAAGFIENTGASVLSGSFKVVTESNSGKLEKVIECVTNGSLFIPQAAAALTGWRRYINSGVGYVPVVTDLLTARTIALTAGQKLIWASENESRSLYQMA
jgi:hypothetical protein